MNGVTLSNVEAETPREKKELAYKRDHYVSAVSLAILRKN